MADQPAGERSTAWQRVEVPMSLSWHVAMVENGMVAEQQMLADPRTKHFEIFYPTIRVLRQWSRGRKVVRIVPYLSGYIFMRFDTDTDYWEPMQKMRGIKDFMYEGPLRPARIRDDQMDRLKEACAAASDETSSEQLSERLFRIGEMINITVGPFASMQARIDAVERNRLTVKLQVLGGEVRARVDKRHVC